MTVLHNEERKEGIWHPYLPCDLIVNDMCSNLSLFLLLLHHSEGLQINQDNAN